MSAQNVLKIIDTTLPTLAPYGIKITDAARTILLAIAGQESNWTHRRQMVGSPPRPTGPASGFWQFERGGGIVGVLNHHTTKGTCQKILPSLNSTALWELIGTEQGDIVACQLARLLLWTDPKALPTLPGPAWDLYIRCWRPGKPHQTAGRRTGAPPKPL